MSKEIKAEIVRLMREEFDPQPPNYGGHSWYDCAEEVADSIIALFARAEARATTAEAQVVAMREAQTGWLVELKGNTPSWAILFSGDYDDHWTTDSTKALRFSRKIDAEAFIAWHGWTETFASEHIWDDARTALLAGTPPSGAETQAQPHRQGRGRQLHPAIG